MRCRAKHVAAVAEEADGEGVAEAVDVGARDAGALADALQDLAQGVAIDLAAARVVNRKAVLVVSSRVAR